MCSSLDNTDRNDQSTNSISLNRAIDCLNQCMILCYESHDDQKRNYLDTARVLLAYVWLEQNNPTQVLNLADQMLNGKPLSSDDKNVYMTSMRQRATMRLYAFEALSLMGRSTEAKNYLHDPELKLPDGDDCNSSLAAQLISVDMTKKKQLNQGELKRMNHAKAAIQIFSANANLATGNVDSAGNEARSACAILANDDEGMNDARGAAHTTLIESLIYDGKVSEAVKVAKSLK